MVGSSELEAYRLLKAIIKMKRYGYLIEKVVEESNLQEAFSMVMRGKKRTRTVRLFKKNRDKILADLAYEIKLSLIHI